MSETRWDIPPDWIWTTAGEIARIVGGGTPNASDPANFSEDGVPWVRQQTSQVIKGSISEGGDDTYLTRV